MHPRILRLDITNIVQRWWHAMKITNNASYIKQQQPGQFKRADDGAGPYAHVNDRKLASTKEQKGWGVYISNDDLVAIEKATESDFPKLFDVADGIQLTSEKSLPNQKYESIQKGYDNTGKSQIPAKQQRLIDQWAWIHADHRIRKQIEIILHMVELS